MLTPHSSTRRPERIPHAPSDADAQAPRAAHGAAPREGSDAVERGAAQRRSLSALARLALETRGSDELVDTVARSVADALGAARASVIDVLPDAGTAIMRGGHGWPPGTPLAVDLGPLRNLIGAAGNEPVQLDGEASAETLPAAWRMPRAAHSALAVLRGERDGATTMIVAQSRRDDAFHPDELAFLAIAADILAGALERTRGEEHARHQAMHDPLTDLANRTLLLDRLQRAMTRAARGGATVALLLLDLDRFSAVNESLGHHFGDELLIAVAQRLDAAFDGDTTLARLGGDEFAILCEGLAGERGAIESAERVQRALDAPIALDEHEVVAHASIGIVVSAARGEEPSSLVRDAQIAVYRAKQQGGDRYELFDPAMRRRTRERLDIERDMRRSLDQDEFEVHYQPIVSLERREIVGLEALVRWRHPERGLISPATFIPLAEESGLILPLGRRVLEEACRQLARWEAHPDIDVPYVSVNLSGRQLAQPDLPEEIGQILNLTGTDPSRLALELTESVLMEETGSPTAVLERLKTLGTRLMLDDFGTGYSSLNYVKRFPVEYIKIDRSFVAGIAEDPGDRHILSAIVSMAAGLGVELIAEGVETAEQAQWLRHLGISLAQGYGFARPALATALEPLLRDGLPLETLAAAFEPLPATTPGEAAPAPEAGGAEPTLTLSEAADALGVSASTLRRWANSGRIRAVRTDGGHRRFPVSDVRRLDAGRSTRQKPVIRSIPAPAGPLPGLSDLLAAGAHNLAVTAAPAVYEAGRHGWFDSPSGRTQVERWALGVASGARTGNYDTCTEATRKLLRQATHAGTTQIERATLVERIAELLVRDLTERDADRSEIVGARRAFLHLRQLVFEAGTCPDCARPTVPSTSHPRLP